MSLRYNKLKNHPTTFKRLFGLWIDEFERILRAVEPQWEKRVVRCYKRPGKNNKLSLSEQIINAVIVLSNLCDPDFHWFPFWH